MMAMIPAWAWRWIAIASVAIAAGGFCWMKGDEHGTQKLIDYQAKEATETIRIAKGRDAVTVQVVERYIEVKGETVTVTQTIEKEVVKYANAGYCLDAEFRWLHDAAAANTVPDPGFKPDGALGAPTAAAALETVTGNYAACHRTADRLDALQAWVRKQQAVK